MKKLLKATRKRAGQLALGATLLGAAQVSQAAVAQAVIDSMGGVVADMLVVGGLILTAAATAFGIRWVKATFF